MTDKEFIYEGFMNLSYKLSKLEIEIKSIQKRLDELERIIEKLMREKSKF